VTMPWNRRGHFRMNRSSADWAKRRRDTSVSAASENRADPPQPPMEIVSFRCGFFALSFCSSPKFPPGCPGSSCPRAQTPTSMQRSRSTPNTLDSGYGLLGSCCLLLVTGCWLLVTGYWLLVTGYWLLVTGYSLLITDYWSSVNSSHKRQPLTGNPHPVR